MVICRHGEKADRRAMPPEKAVDIGAEGREQETARGRESVDDAGYPDYGGGDA
jgi:hypothetical protein